MSRWGHKDIAVDELEYASCGANHGIELGNQVAVVWLALGVDIAGKAVPGICLAQVDSIVQWLSINLSNGAIGAREGELTNVDGDGCALDAGVSHISEHAHLVADKLSLKPSELLLSISALVVELEDWDQKDGKESENQNEEPEHVHVGGDSKSKLSQRI